MEERGALTRKELFFFIGVILYYSTFFVELTVLTDTWDLNNPVFRGIRLVSYVLFFIVILDEIILRKTLLLFVVLIPVILLCALYGDDNSVIYMLLIMMAGLCTSSKRWISFVMWLQIICLVLVVGLSITGVFEDILYISEDRVRHCLGFFWTTTPALMAFFVSCALVYIRAEKISWIEIILMELVQVILYILTDSKMCFMTATLLVVLTVLLRFNILKRFLYGVSRLAVIFPVLCCVVSIAAQAMYDENSAAWQAADNFFNKRLALGHAALDEYGITFFGQYIKWVGNTQRSQVLEYNYVDNSYLQVLLTNGIFFLAIIIILYTVILIRAVRQRELYTVMVVSLILMLSMTEPRLWNWTFNPFPFLIIDIMKEHLPVRAGITARTGYRSRY